MSSAVVRRGAASGHQHIARCLLCLTCKLAAGPRSATASAAARPEPASMPSLAMRGDET